MTEDKKPSLEELFKQYTDLVASRPDDEQHHKAMERVDGLVYFQLERAVQEETRQRVNTDNRKSAILHHSALRAVKNAEQVRTQQSIDEAKLKVVILPDSVLKTQLVNQLTAVKVNLPERVKNTVQNFFHGKKN